MAPKKDKRFLLNVLSLFLLLFIDGMSQGIVFPLLIKVLMKSHVPFHHVAPGQANLYYGLLIGTFFLFWFFGAPLLSDYSDKVGRKKVLAICLIGSFFGFFLTALGFIFKSLTLLFIGRIVNGVTAGSQPIGQAAIVDICPPEQKTRYFGLILFAVCVGIIVGPLIGAIFSNPAVLPFFNNRTPMYVAMAFSVINLVLLFLYFSETKKNAKTARIQISKCVTISASAITDRKVNLLAIVFLFVQMGWSMFYFYNNSLLISRFNYPGYLVAFYIAALGFGITIGFTLLVRWFEKVRKKLCVLIGYGLVGLATIVSIIAYNPIYFWIAVVPAGAGMGLGYANILAIFSSQTTADKQGWVMGITSSLLAAGAAAMALLVGPLTSISDITPFLVSVAILIIGLIIFLCDRAIETKAN